MVMSRPSLRPTPESKDDRLLPLNDEIFILCLLLFSSVTDVLEFTFPWGW